MWVKDCCMHVFLVSLIHIHINFSYNLSNDYQAKKESSQTFVSHVSTDLRSSATSSVTNFRSSELTGSSRLNCKPEINNQKCMLANQVNWPRLGTWLSVDPIFCCLASAPQCEWDLISILKLFSKVGHLKSSIKKIET